MPFAGYKDFDECVSKNGDKEDPAAYCAAIQQKAEKEGDTTKEHVIHDLFETNESDFSVFEGTGELKSRNVIIRAGRSKNRRHYRESTLRDAATRGIFNGTRMFVNHSDKLPTRRSLTEMVSGVDNVVYDEEKKALVGDVVYFSQEFYDFAKRAQNFMGNSIAALVEGQKRKDNDGTYFEDISRIVQPRSVDWVVFPAAGGGIEAFVSEGEDDVDWNELTLEALEENAPALIEELKQKLAPPPADPPADPPAEPQPVVLTAESVQNMVQQLLHEAAEATAKRDAEQAKIREYVGKSGLPERTKVRLMTQFALAESFDEEKVNAAVTEAREELKAAGAGPKITGQGPTGTPAVAVAKRRSREVVEGFFGATTKE